MHACVAYNICMLRSIYLCVCAHIFSFTAIKKYQLERMWDNGVSVTTVVVSVLVRYCYSELNDGNLSDYLYLHAAGSRTVSFLILSNCDVRMKEGKKSFLVF